MAFSHPQRLLIALGVICAALVMVAISLTAWTHSRQQRVLATLGRYQDAGLLNHPLITDKNPSYRLSAVTLDYTNAKTWGQVKQDLKNIAQTLAADPQAVERRLTFRQYASAIATHLSAGTRFKDRVVVNKLPPQGHLGIFFLSADPQGLLPGFSDDTCAYLTGTTVIVCNAHSVQRALTALDQTVQNMTTMISVTAADGSLRVTSVGHIDIVRQFLKQNFLVWLFGHEIGHAQLHHATSGTSDLHFDLRYDEREREADDFVVKATHGDNAARAAFPGMLLEFIEQQFQARYVAQHGMQANVIPARNSPTEQIDVPLPKSGVPLILRAMRIMDRTLLDDSTAFGKAAYVVVDDRLAYVGSIKSAEYYRFLKSRIVLPQQQGQPPKSHAPAILGAALVAAFVALSIVVITSRKESA